MDRDLAEAVERAYAVFAAPAPADLSVCTWCCMDPETERRVLATPQCEIAVEDVHYWYQCAYDDDRAVVMWLLPRIFDLIARGKNPNTIGSLLERLGSCGYPEGWTQDQTVAVERCVLLLARRALWFSVRQSEDPIRDWFDWLTEAAEANIPLGPLIEDAMAAPPPLLARELTELRWDGQIESLVDPWMPGLTQARQAEVASLLVSPKLLDILSAGLAVEVEPDWAAWMKETRETLKRWHEAGPSSRA